MESQNSENSNLNPEKENVYPAKSRPLAGRSGVIPAHAGILSSPLFISVLFILVLGFGIFLGKTFFSSSGQSFNSPTPEVSAPTAEPTTDPTAASNAATANWKTYKNEKYGFEFKYPENMESLISGKQGSITVNTKDELISQYDSWSKKGGCPSTCGKLSADKKLLMKQFWLLEELNTNGTCELSRTYIDDVKSNFILFQSGVGGNLSVKGIKIGNKCALGIITFNGYDVNLSNYYYQTVFIKDNLIVGIGFQIFPIHVVKEVDNLWSSFGFNLDKSFCDSVCNKKMSKYFEKFDPESSIVKNVILTYNQILSTFKFTNSTTISEDEAVQLVKSLDEVKNYLSTVSNATVEVDHESDDKTLWVVHVYEIKNGHTATFNWFEVNKITKSINKML